MGFFDDISAVRAYAIGKFTESDLGGTDYPGPRRLRR